MSSVMPWFDVLALRRRELGISYSVLARLSGVSKPAIQRLLTGKVGAPGLSNVTAVALALGMEGIRFRTDGSIQFDSSADVQTLREEQALKKAQKMVAMDRDRRVLDAQKVGEAEYRAMVERMYGELLTGSSRRLWSKIETSIDGARPVGLTSSAATLAPVSGFADSF
jgi:transcriptional regulator with XRE-family HTH domain